MFILCTCCVKYYQGGIGIIKLSLNKQTYYTVFYCFATSGGQYQSINTGIRISHRQCWRTMLDVGITWTGNHTYPNWLSQFTTTCTTCTTQLQKRTIGYMFWLRIYCLRHLQYWGIRLDLQEICILRYRYLPPLFCKLVVTHWESLVFFIRKATTTNWI